MAADAKPGGPAGVSLIMPTRIVIVGGGGREHALAWKLAGEPGVNEVIVTPGSDAIGDEPRVRCVRGVDPLDAAAVVAVARREAAELVVIGPEAPLAAGVADALIEAGFAVFGPTQGGCADRVEQGVLPRRRASSRRADGEESGVFRRRAAARAFASELARSGRGVVVKADGLAAGKGVTVCDTYDEAAGGHRRTCVLARRKRTPARMAPWVVVEERLSGPRSERHRAL